MGAVDCTQEQGLCKTFDVRGYPTFKYFSYYDKEQKDYDGGRLKNDFVQFMKDPSKKGAPAVAATQEGGEDSWSDKPGSEYLLHLHDNDFEKKLRSLVCMYLYFFISYSLQFSKVILQNLNQQQNCLFPIAFLQKIWILYELSIGIKFSWCSFYDFLI